MSSAGWQEVIAHGGASLVSEVLAELAGAQGFGGGGAQQGSVRCDAPVVPHPMPVRKRSADEAGLVVPYMSQRRQSVSDDGAGADRAAAASGEEAGGSSTSIASCGCSADVRNVAGMRVAKLRRELDRRGLSTLGRRGRLVERLQAVICAEEKEALARSLERERLERERARLVDEASQAESDM